MFEKRIIYFSQPAKVICDGRCSKAWGINNRPKEMLSTNEDDYAYFADHELDDAPADPGTYEGGYGKPANATSAADMNKWCVRECERSEMSLPGKADEPLELPDFSTRLYNIPSSRPRS